MLQATKEAVPVERLAVHFHNTYGQALSNILIALQRRAGASHVQGQGGAGPQERARPAQEVPGATGHRGQAAARQRQAAAAGRQEGASMVCCGGWGWRFDGLRSAAQDRAKLALKLKKFKEQQMQQADEHLIQVLGMLDTVEWETQQLQVFEGLKAGNSILNAIHKVRTGFCKNKLQGADKMLVVAAGDDGGSSGGADAGDGRSTGDGECSLTVEDEDAVLSELAEIEKLEADALAAAMPEAPTAALETGTERISSLSSTWPSANEALLAADISVEVPTATAAEENTKSKSRAVKNKKEAVAILG
ncbi:unnamed protein product [Phytophthora lilii]|uniref:Unnamed protein product n=1 Tax=Phytophthora lilii TaxID=2077276 RepID=A0A9W6UBJ4_9STRA|nr:unnamed protein product [Phytophthora lilii]